MHVHDTDTSTNKYTKEISSTSTQIKIKQIPDHGKDVHAAYIHMYTTQNVHACMYMHVHAPPVYAVHVHVHVGQHVLIYQ